MSHTSAVRGYEVCLFATVIVEPIKMQRYLSSTCISLRGLTLYYKTHHREFKRKSLSITLRYWVTAVRYARFDFWAIHKNASWATHNNITCSSYVMLMYRDTNPCVSKLVRNSEMNKQTNYLLYSQHNHILEVSGVKCCLVTNVLQDIHLQITFKSSGICHFCKCFVFTFACNLHIRRSVNRLWAVRGRVQDAKNIQSC